MVEWDGLFTDLRQFFETAPLQSLVLEMIWEIEDSFAEKLGVPFLGWGSPIVRFGGFRPRVGGSVRSFWPLVSRKLGRDALH